MDSAPSDNTKEKKHQWKLVRSSFCISAPPSSKILGESARRWSCLATSVLFLWRDRWTCKSDGLLRCWPAPTHRPASAGRMRAATRKWATPPYNKSKIWPARYLQFLVGNGGMDYGDYGDCYYRDPFPHSLPSTRHQALSPKA